MREVTGQSTDREDDSLTRAFTDADGRARALDAESIARALIEAKVAPNAAAGACVKRGDAWRTESGGERATFFDLASVTKPMTAWAAARAAIDRGATLGSIVREAIGTASEDASIELLLAHRAGLEPHAPMFAPLVCGEAVVKADALRMAANARRAETIGREYPAEGFAPLYSDLGYVLAGEMLARSTGARDAGEAIARLVVERLGVVDSLGTARELASRGVDLASRAAPTEDVAWRGGLVRGRVHDENAWALTGDGGSGHAGMFGTIDAVLAFGRAVLEAVDAGDERFAWLVRARPGGTLRAGFDGKSDAGSSAGTRAGPRTFGHLGFTGTSLWIDPDARAVVAILTNRVCPTRDHVAIRAARPLAHDALFARAALLGAP